MDYLNEEQKKAINAGIDKPLIVIAAAGTGKTTVLAHRIVALVKNYNIDPKKILAFTHTNAATNQMKERIKKIFGSDDQSHKQITIRTIDSTFSILLREYWSKSEDDCWRSKYEILENLVKEKEYKDLIPSRSKEEEFNKYRKQKYLVGTKNPDPNWELIMKTMKEKNQLDFLGVQLELNSFMERSCNSHRVNDTKNRYKVILMDECQDLTDIQWLLIKKLIDKEKTIFFAVGDPNQAIYKFAGALDGIFDEIKKFFNKNVEQICLFRNYRSDKLIVEESNNSRKFKVGLTAAVAISKERGNVTKISSIDSIVEKIVEAYENNELHKWVVLSGSLKNEYLKKNIRTLLNNKIPLFLSEFHSKYEGFSRLINLLRISFFDSSKPLFKYIRAISKGGLYKVLVDNRHCIKSEEHLLKKIIDKKIFKSEKHIDFFQKLRSLREKDKINISSFIKDYLVDLEMPIFLKYLNKKIEDSKKKINKEAEIKKAKEEIYRFADYLSLIPKDEEEEAWIHTRNIVLDVDSYLNASNEDLIKVLNSKKNQLIITTVHKSKGLEWENVIVFDDNLGGKDTNKEDQKQHLPYVAYSRAKNNLYLIQKPTKKTLNDE